jgi:hypothetical protein
MKNESELPNLYDVTGNVLDVNTLLVNRVDLRKQQEALCYLLKEIHYINAISTGQVQRVSTSVLKQLPDFICLPSEKTLLSKLQTPH